MANGSLGPVRLPDGVMRSTCFDRDARPGHSPLRPPDPVGACNGGACPAVIGRRGRPYGPFTTPGTSLHDARSRIGRSGSNGGSAANRSPPASVRWSRISRRPRFQPDCRRPVPTLHGLAAGPVGGAGAGGHEAGQAARLDGRICNADLVQSPGGDAAVIALGAEVFETSRIQQVRTIQKWDRVRHPPARPSPGERKDLRARPGTRPEHVSGCRRSKPLPTSAVVRATGRRQAVGSSDAIAPVGRWKGVARTSIGRRSTGGRWSLWAQATDAYRRAR